MTNDPTTDHLRQVHQISEALAGVLGTWGPPTDLLHGLRALSLLTATCLAPQAAQAWRTDARMRLIIDDMVAGLGPGYYKQGLRDLVVPDPQRGRAAPPGTAERWARLVRDLDAARSALRPAVSADEIAAMAMHCDDLQVITTTSRYVGGGSGSQVCVQRSLHAITRDAGDATRMAQDLQQRIRPPCDQRALLAEMLDEFDDVLERLESGQAAVRWPRDGGWIGPAAFDDWCRSVGVSPDQAEGAIQDAIGCTLTGQEGAAFAEIRSGGTNYHANHGWMLHFDRVTGFSWQEESWDD